MSSPEYTNGIDRRRSLMIKKLDEIGDYAKMTKFGRLQRTPVRYIKSIWWQHIAYRLFKSDHATECLTFWGRPFHLNLPSATGIYLSGGKTHDSEVRLAKFLVHSLNRGDVFWDIGSHFGYYSALAAELVGAEGQVLSVEPSPWTYRILNKNTVPYQNIITLNKAISNKKELLNFYEFPSKYSEYNSLNIDQYKNEKWFKHNPPKKHTIEAISIDQLAKEYKRPPNIIKIDVEGGELNLLKGGQDVIENYQECSLVLEYIPDQVHDLALELMSQQDWQLYNITTSGSLKKLTMSPSQYLSSLNLESDNLVLRPK